MRLKNTAVGTFLLQVKKLVQTPWNSYPQCACGLLPVEARFIDGLWAL